MNIVAIVGSIKRDSYNKKIAEFVKNRYSKDIEVDVLTLEDIPMYNEDEELDPPESVREMRERIKNSDGIIFFTPEYNYSIPGVLKNALDWISRVERVMIGKPSMTIGASQGILGTVKAQDHLKDIIDSPTIGAINLPGAEVYVTLVQNKFDPEGDLIDDNIINHLDSTIDKFIAWVKKING